MKHTLELSSFEVSILRAALAAYAESAKRKAEPGSGTRAAPAANSVQAAVAISGLDKRLAEFQQTSA